jgi:hypothetical protein
LTYSLPLCPILKGAKRTSSETAKRQLFTRRYTTGLLIADCPALLKITGRCETRGFIPYRGAQTIFALFGYFTASRLREMAYKKHFIAVDTKTLLGASHNPLILEVVVKYQTSQE